MAHDSSYRSRATHRGYLACRYYGDLLEHPPHAENGIQKGQMNLKFKLSEVNENFWPKLMRRIMFV